MRGAMLMAIEFFTRKELKYVITMDQFQELLIRMAPYMRADTHGNEGEYTVSSLYFDSDDKRIYFEIKQKHQKVVYKRRMALPLHEAYRYLNQEEDQSLDKIHTSNQQVLKEIDHLRHLYQLRPEMIVSYDRKALHGIEDPDFRVT